MFCLISLGPMMNKGTESEELHIRNICVYLRKWLYIVYYQSRHMNHENAFLGWLCDQDVICKNRGDGHLLEWINTQHDLVITLEKTNLFLSSAETITSAHHHLAHSPQWWQVKHDPKATSVKLKMHRVYKCKSILVTHTTLLKRISCWFQGSHH